MVLCKNVMSLYSYDQFCASIKNSFFVGVKARTHNNAYTLWRVTL